MDMGRDYSFHIWNSLLRIWRLFSCPLSVFFSGINNSNILNFWKATFIQCSLYFCPTFLLSLYLSHMFPENHCPRLCILYSRWIFFRAKCSRRFHVFLIIFFLIHCSLMMRSIYCNSLTLLTCAQLMNSEEPIYIFTGLPLNKLLSSQSCAMNYYHPRNKKAKIAKGEEPMRVKNRTFFSCINLHSTNDFTVVMLI